MIVETTNYFASEGNIEAVLKQRRKASAIRVKLGLLPGRILTKLEGAGPDVLWECCFEDQAAFEADMAARAGSADFTAARKEMHQLLNRFERNLFAVADDD